MNARVLLLFVFAIASVGVVMFLTRNYLTGLEEQANQRRVQAPAETQIKHRIYVAADDLDVGTILDETHLTTQPWPEEALNTAYIKDTRPKTDIIGKVVRAPLTKGEPYTSSAIVAPGERGFMAAILKPGMRAATVNLSPSSGVGGFIFPGDRVDVILAQTVVSTDGTENNVAETVMQNVRVLGVDQSSQSLEAGAKIRRTATLEVTAQMAEKIAMLERLGTLSLVLRSLAQDGTPKLEPVDKTISSTLDSDISQFRARLSQKEKDKKNEVIVRRGATVTAVEVDEQKSAGGRS